MPTRKRFDRAKEEERVRRWYSTFPWVPLTERYPEVECHVLLRMADERVIGARWMGTDWWHSPFEQPGEPVAWAKVPEAHKSP